MSNRNTYTEKNVQKLIGSSLKDENKPDTQYKDVVLNMLLQKIAQQKRELQPKPINVIGLSVMWIIIPVLLFAAFTDSIYILDFIKIALGLSLFFIPVSSIILIILKLRSHEKKMV